MPRCISQQGTCPCAVTFNDHNAQEQERPEALSLCSPYADRIKWGYLEADTSGKFVIIPDLMEKRAGRKPIALPLIMICSYCQNI